MRVDVKLKRSFSVFTMVGFDPCVNNNYNKAISTNRPQDQLEEDVNN